MTKACIYSVSTLLAAAIFGGPYQNGWQGSGIFAISPACRRQRRIAVSRRTLHQPF
jgi:hypothetical protein